MELTALTWTMAFGFAISVLMYFSGEFSRAVYKDYGKKSLGMTSFMYKWFHSEEDPDGILGKISAMVLLFCTLFWVTLIYQDSVEGGNDFKSTEFKMSLGFVEILKIFVGIHFFGGVVVAMFYGMFLLGFLRGHFMNKRHQFSNN